MITVRWSGVHRRVTLILGLVVALAAFGFAAADHADAKPRVIRAVGLEGSSKDAFNPAIVACDTTRPGTRFQITVSVVNRGRVIARSSRVRISGPKRCASFGSAIIRLPRDRTMRDRAVARATNLTTRKSASRVLIFPGHG